MPRCVRGLCEPFWFSFCFSRIQVPVILGVAVAVGPAVTFARQR